MKPVVQHPAAEREWEEAFQHYAEIDPELARDFNHRLRAAFMVISRIPEQFPRLPSMPRLQKHLLRRFPYKIIFLNREQDIFIVAIMHGSRKPGYWAGRVS